jgi:hypothetical protein
LAKENSAMKGCRRYLVLVDFFGARFEGFAEELVAGTTSAALFLAHRAPTILRAWALRSSGVSFAQRALPPSDWIIFRCSRTVRSFLSFLSIFLYRRRGVSQIYRNCSFNIGNKPVDGSKTNPRTNSARGSRLHRWGQLAKPTSLKGI